MVRGWEVVAGGRYGLDGWSRRAVARDTHSVDGRGDHPRPAGCTDAALAWSHLFAEVHAPGRRSRGLGGGDHLGDGSGA